MKRLAIYIIIITSFVFMLFQPGFAEVSSEEAAKLKTTLTPMGAEKAGNADGTIPAWEGGYKTVPPEYKPGDPRIDPFADEKPLYSITAQNLDQHADKLNEGVKALYKKYPETYRIDVYPTHRTASAPQFVYDATFKNATRAETTDNGLSVEGAYNGIPFPIPKDGYELIWNHLLAWRGISWESSVFNFLMTTTGKLLTVAKQTEHNDFPFYYQEVPMEEWEGDYHRVINWNTYPPFKVGQCILVRDPVDQLKEGRRSWQYLTGQRRTRRAPQVSYDTPDFVGSGHNYFDEVYVFNGSLDRYDWKIIGKKEMVIPYNTNGFHLKKLKEVMNPGHVNPDYLRWELHRVWVVEGTLAAGKRHVVQKRRAYLDEDTWRIHLQDMWDGKGQLWRFNFSVPFVAPDVPGHIHWSMVLYNLQTWNYGGNILANGERIHWKHSTTPKPDSFYTPANLSAVGVR